MSKPIILEIVSYDEETMREMVSRYEKLVPELRIFHVEINEDTLMKVISVLPIMMQYFDAAPAADTKVIRKYISDEKIAEYSEFLKGNSE